VGIATTNPATGQTLRTFDPLGDDEIGERIALAAQTFASYRKTSFERRAGWMRAAADLLDAQAGDIAALMTQEMGKTLTAAQAEVAKCA
jgi:succinate-semialdehyde dehydrogenase/glutarate-semialdehyde dehydrogenase